MGRYEDNLLSVLAETREALRTVRVPVLPVARYIDTSEPPTVLEFETVEVPVVHAAGPYRVADLYDIGEWHVVDTRTRKTDFRTTDRVLARMVADSFHREGL